MSVEPLVSVEWLKDHLNEPTVRPIDVRWYLTEPGRGRAEYDAGHIPGAPYMSLDDDLAAPRGQGPGRHPLPMAEAFARAAGRAGIGADTHVIAYDASGGTFVAVPHPELVVDAAMVDALRRDPRALLLDARLTERYEGRVEPIDPQPGH